MEICCPDTGIPLWTTIRLAFLRMVMEDVLYSVPLVGRHSGSRAWSLLRYAATFPRSFAYNALRLHALHQPYPVILMATGVRLLKRGRTIFQLQVTISSRRHLSALLRLKIYATGKWPLVITIIYCSVLLSVWKGVKGTG